MAQIVKLRRSAVTGKTPTNAQLELGELSMNTVDGKLYFAKSGSAGPTIEELISTNAVNTGSINISGSINVTGSTTATEFTGSGLGLTNVPMAFSGSLPAGGGIDTTFTRLKIDDTTGLRISGTTNGDGILSLVNVSSEGRTAKLVVSSASSTWTLNHNLGEQYPAITVFDSNGEVIIPQTIDAVSDSQLVVYFSTPQTGVVTATVGGGLPLIESGYAGRILTVNDAGTGPEWQPYYFDNALSTGLVESGHITVDVTGQTFTIGAVKGYVVDNETDPLNPAVTFVSYTGGTFDPSTTNVNDPAYGLDLTGYTTTNVFIQSNGIPYFTQDVQPLPSDRNTKIYVGHILHPNGTMLYAGGETDYAMRPFGAIRDIWDSLGVVNDGIAISANTGLTINVSEGYIQTNGVNFNTSSTDPNRKLRSAVTGFTFNYRTQTGAGSNGLTNLDPTTYDLTGTTTTIPDVDNYASNQYFYMAKNGTLLIQYGQSYHTSLAEAVAHVGREPHIQFSNLVKNSVLLGAVSIRRNTTDISDTSYAIFHSADKFGNITKSHTLDAIASDIIQFGTSYNASGDEPTGTFYYNIDDDTMDIVTTYNTYQLGQELSPLYKNGSPTVPIINGAPVMYSGATISTGYNYMTLQLANASSSFNPLLSLGVATSPLAANGGIGKATWFGRVNGVNLAYFASLVGETWTDGDILYVNTTSGQYTKTEPSAPNNSIAMASIVKYVGTDSISTPNTGTSILFVRPHWASKISTLADVNGNPTVTGDIITWNNTNGYYEFTHNVSDFLTVSGGTITGTLNVESGLNVTGNTTTTGHIIPSTTDTYDLGSATYQWRDLYLSSGSLYIDGTQVISSDATTIIVTTDAGQDFKILETGTDDVTIQTADGNIELKSSGGGNVLIDPTTGLVDVRGTMQIQDGNKITSSGGTSIVFGDGLIISGSITLTGTVNGVDVGGFKTSYDNYTGSNDDRLDSLESSTGSLDGRVDSLELTSGSHSNRLDSLETTSGSHGDRLDNIETSTGSLNTYTSSLDDAIEITGSNLTVKGNFLVKGTQTIVNSTTVDIGDNIISLNGSGAAYGGIEVQDATAPDLVSGSLLWDATNNYWIAGPKGSEVRVLDSSDYSTLVNVSGDTMTGNLSINSGGLNVTGVTSVVGNLVSTATITGSTVFGTTVTGTTVNSDSLNSYSGLTVYSGGMNVTGNTVMDAITGTSLTISGAITASTTITASSISTDGNYYGNYGSGSTDITSLVAGSTFGGLIQGPNSGHSVIGLRDNDTGDSFSIISGGGDYTTNQIWDKLVAQFRADGYVRLGGNVNIESGGGLRITGTTVIDSSRNIIGVGITGTTGTFSGVITASGGTSTQWNSAYSFTSTFDITNYTDSKYLRSDTSDTMDGVLSIKRGTGSPSITSTADNGGHLVLDPNSGGGDVYISHYYNSNTYISTGTGNIGMGTTDPLSLVNNTGLQLDKGGHTMFLIGDGVNDGGVIQSSDNGRRIIMGANIYDDSTNSWSKFNATGATASFDAIGYDGFGMARITVGNPADAGYPPVFLEAYNDDATSYLRMGTKVSNVLNINNSGNIGIKTTGVTSGYVLDVNGSTIVQGNLNVTGNLTGTTGTYTTSVTSPYIRLTNTTDASLISTGHAFQIGSTTSTNLIMDNNEIMCRNNGAVSGLNFNPDGGDVTIHNNTTAGTFTIGGNTVWHSGNDGSGSGLDADTLDGFQLQTQSNLGQAWGVIPTIKSDGVMEVGRYIDFQHTSASGIDYGARLHTNGTSNGQLFINGEKIWHSGNDGSGSGLDADKLDGIQATSFVRSDADDTKTGYLKTYTTVGSADNVRTSSGFYDDTTQAAGIGGQIVLGYKYTDSGSYTEGAIIKMYKENATSGHYGSGLRFQVRNNGADLSTKMTLDPSGHLSTVGDITIAGRYYTTSNTATGLSNGTFNVAKSVLGNIHIKNGSGPAANAGYQAAITFMGSSATESQAGIYVHNNNSYGTAMAFATTQSYATGPQIFLSGDANGNVSIPRGSLTTGGSIVISNSTTNWFKNGNAWFGRNHTYDTAEIRGYGSELMIGSQGPAIHINYRTCNGGTANHTPTTWYWRAGSSTNYSTHYFGTVGTAHTGTLDTPNTYLRMNANAIQFGGNNNGFETNSAQISAGYHQANSLCIVGMGSTSPARRIDMWAEAGIHIYGSLISKSSANYDLGTPSLLWGTVYASAINAGTITETSSIRYKENITAYTGGLNELMLLEPVRYNRIGETTSELGFIAEEVAKVVPEFVGFNEENLPDSVMYGRITTILINSVKELKEEVDKLKNNG